MCHPLPLVPIARGHGNVPNQDQFGKSKSHDKSLDTANEKLEEFMKGPWLAFQKLLKSLDYLTTVHLSRSLWYRDNELFRNSSGMRCCFSSQHTSIFIVFFFFFFFLITRSFGSRGGSVLVACHSQVDGGLIERFFCHFIENVVAQRSRGSRDVKIAVHLSSSIVFFPQSDNQAEQCHITSNLHHPTLLNY